MQFSVFRGAMRYFGLFAKFPHCALTYHSVEKRDVLSQSRKKNCEINSLVISLEKMLLSRNFSLKSVRENSRNFHTVTLYCENCEILLPPFRRKNSVKATLSLKNFTPNYYDGKYFAWRVNFTFFHNVQCNGGFSTLPNFVQNSIFQ